jgi:hypothetical protein
VVHCGRSRLPRGVAAAALVLVLAGCSAGTDSAADAGCADPSAAPTAETERMPDGLSFDKVGTVTHVANEDGNITVQAVSTKPLDELTVLIQDAVTAAGYRPAGMDNEGDEAEVFFNSGSVAAGQAQVREADCEGQWDIELVLIDPDSVPTTPPAT